MAIFKKKPDPISLTMALVQAYAVGDQAAVEQARQGLASVPTMGILYGLFQFGQILSKANLTPEQTAAISAELEATPGTPEMTAAIQNIGRAILIARSQPALVEAVNSYGSPLLSSTNDHQMRQMCMALASITGSVCRQLGVNFNWK